MSTQPRSASAAFARAEPFRLRGLAAELARREPLLAAVGLALFATMLPTLVAWAVDPRTLYGVSVWAKPLKFQASVGLFLVTLAWVWGHLDAGARAGRLARVAVWLAVATALFEIGYISFQAGRGVGSHFNEATTVEALMFRLMGVAAVILTGTGLVPAILLVRRRRGPLSPVRLAIVLGLVLTFVLGVPTGAALVANGSHWVGGVASDAGGLAVFGWSRSGGDLRVAHFFAIHAMQIVPAIGCLAARATDVATARAAVWLAAGATVLLTVATFAGAAIGRPFLPFLG